MSLSTPSLAATEPPVRLVMHRLTLAAGAGAPSIAVLEAGAADLRARDHLRARARAASAGIRSSSTVLSVLPLVLIALSVLIDPGVVGEVFARPVFAATALCGVLLNQVGRIWMRRITQAVLS
jgi:Flp pilus assembly protein TadB